MVAAPHRAERLGSAQPGPKDAPVLDDLPVIEVHESLPFVSRYWASVFDSRPAAPGTVIVPDLRAVLACAIAAPGSRCCPAICARWR